MAVGKAFGASDLSLSHQLWLCPVCFPKEVERNLQDAMQVCRNVLLDPQLVPGGGACEMAVAHALTEKSKAMTGVEQWPYRAVAQALEVIPRTLIQNCGASTIRLLTSLRVSPLPATPSQPRGPWAGHCLRAWLTFVPLAPLLSFDSFGGGVIFSYPFLAIPVFWV